MNIRAFLFKALGTILLVISVCFVLASRSRDLEWPWWSLLVLGGCFFGLGSVAFRHGAKIIFDTRLTSDRRPAILYLRSFTSDALTGSSPINPTTTDDARIAEALEDIGPITSVALPDGMDRPLGRREVTLGENQWRVWVEEAMRTAPLVVLFASATEGVLWEFARVVDIVPPEKLVILIGQKHPYLAFRAAVNEVLPSRLPDYAAASWLRPFWAGPKALIYFSSDWTPHYVILKHPVFHSSNLAGALKLALRPVYRQLGVPWTAPPFVMWLRLPNLIIRPFLKNKGR